MSPQRSAFQLSAGEVKVVPEDAYIHKADEGALVVFVGTFDHPDCGIRVECGLPGDHLLDTGDNYTVANYMIGSSRYENAIYAHVPPDTPPGLYVIKRSSHWFWERWLRLSLINTGTASHWVLGYGYHLFLARRGRVEE